MAAPVQVRTVAERVARGEEPVRAEYLRPVGPPPAAGARGGGKTAEKSKNQKRRERAAFLKDGSHLCSGFIRGQCKFGDSCKLSHDLDTFWKLKPADLPGKCPFESSGGKCRYSVGCRYARGHSAESNCGLEVQQPGPAAEGTGSLGGGGGC